MKKTIGIFSLAVLLLSNFAPILTYAYDEDSFEQAKEILGNELDNSLTEFYSNNTLSTSGNNVELNMSSMNELTTQGNNENKKTITYDANGGYFEVGVSTKAVEYTKEGDEYVPNINIQLPNKDTNNPSVQSGWMFVGWYTKSGLNNQWGEEWTGNVTDDTIDKTVYAKWFKFNDLVVNIGGNIITIMDRNLGAENPAIGIHKSDNNNQAESNDKLGFQYQYGNNYGFKNIKKSTETNVTPYNNEIINMSNYGPNNYYYNAIYRINDYWIGGDGSNAWGGGNEDNEDINKQGPCPKGYHIPEMKEWNAIIEIFKKESKLDPTYCSEFGEYEIGKCFAKKLKLPFGGNADSWSNGPYINHYVGSYGYYATSSQYSNKSSYYITFDEDSFGVYSHDFGYGYPVRCFKNSETTNKLIFSPNNGDDDIEYDLRWYNPVTINYQPENPSKEGDKFLGWYSGDQEVTFFAPFYINKTTRYTAKWGNSDVIEYDANGGVFNDGVNKKSVTHSIVNGNYIPSENIQIPKKEGYMFAGWYTSGTNQSHEWLGRYDTVIESNPVVYARWLPFEELVINMGGKSFTIMDRNLGAENVASGTYYGPNNAGHENLGILGYHYQWGNNHGFKLNSDFDVYSNIELNNSIDGSVFGPGNYYFSTIFKVNEESPYSWAIEPNKNLWGGGNYTNTDIERQGPCPEGYHVPEVNEWNALYNAFLTEKNSNSLYCSEFGDSNVGKCFASKIKLPFAGSLSREKGKLVDLGRYGYYWSSTPNKSQSYMLSMTSDRVYTQGFYYNAGWSVRCFKNVESHQIIINPDNGDDNIIYNVKTWDPITKDYIPNNITKDGYTFVGWFNEDTNEEFIFSENTYTEGLTNIIAKREKNPRYTFNAEGGQFEGGRETEIIKYNRASIGTKYSHTANVNDSGDWPQSYYDKNLNSNDVVTIDGATKLRLKIKVQSNSNSNGGYDYLVFWVGSHGDYRADVNSDAAYGGLMSGWNYSDFYEYEIPGNSVTFGFVSYPGGGGPGYGYYSIIEGFKYEGNKSINIPIRPGYEFLGWYEENSETPFDIENTLVTEDKTLYAHWKSLEEKAEETATENVVYTNTTTVTVGNEPAEEVLSGSSTLTLVAEEVKQQEVKKEEDTTKVQDSEIKVTSDKTVEYEGGLEVYLEKIENVGTENETTGKVEGTIKFSAPVAVKIPISSDAEYVKVQVKHGDEDFGFKGLTLNPVNECNNGEAVNDKYNGEDVLVTGNTQKYATIYTCSASTFVAYTESKKPVEPTPSAGGGRTITTTKQENKVTEQEHNSADTEEQKTTNTQTTNTTTPENIKQQVIKVQERSLTRGEVAIMTNILLEVYPQLVEGKTELDDVTNACSNYADEQNFTKDEKKAITRLCKLSIMGIHNDTNEPLEEFLVNNKSTNDEFSKVINRSIENYNEKDLSTIKDALKKLEGDEESVVFGTLFGLFMSIKDILN